MDFKLDKFETYDDERGRLVVFLKESELDLEMKKFGQVYFVTFEKTGIIRGNHYHKKWHEWFGVVGGKVEVILEDINTKEQKKFILDSSEDHYSRLKIGPNIAHTFKSLTDDVFLLNYANGMWHPYDTFEYKLL